MQAYYMIIKLILRGLEIEGDLLWMNTLSNFCTFVLFALLVLLLAQVGHRGSAYAHTTAVLCFALLIYQCV